MSFSVQTEFGEWYYSLFYHLALLCFFLIYLIYGVWKKYPLVSWTLIGFSGIISFMIGSRIGAMDWNQILEFITTARITHPPGQTDLPGILLGLMGVVAATYFLGFKKAVFGVFAYAVPVAIIIQRFGCLFAGCCFGSITDFPIAVQYASHYRIFQHHEHLGAISNLHDFCMPVHPVPIYIMCAAFLTLMLTIGVQKYLKKDGSLLLVSMVSLLSLRFIIEFFRDPVTNHAMGDFFWGLKMIQWALLGIVLGIIPIIYRLERRATLPLIQRHKEISFEHLRKWVLFIALLGLMAFANQLFATRDLVNIFIKIVLAGSIILIYYAPGIIRNPVQITTVLLSIGSLLFMSQTIANNRNNTNSDSTSVADHVREVKKWISTGAFLANPSGDFRKFQGSGCEAVLIEHEKFEGRYAGGLWYEQSSHKKPGSYELFGVGTNISSYMVTDILHANSKIGNKGSFSIGTYFGRDRTNFGFKLGGYLGDLKVITPISQEVSKKVFAPILQIRAGHLDQIYGQFGIFDDLHQGPFASVDRLILGINLNSPGAINQSILELGTVNLVARGNTRLYLGGRFNLTKTWYFKPDLQFGKSFYCGLGRVYNSGNSSESWIYTD